MVVTENSQRASIGQAAQKAGAKRNSGASGSSFADVLVGQTEEPRGKGGKTKPKAEGPPKAEAKQEPAAKEPVSKEPADEIKAEDAPKEAQEPTEGEMEELEKPKGDDANAYLMQMLLSQAQATVTPTATADANAAPADEIAVDAVNLNVLEGVAPAQAEGQTTDPNAIAQGEEMARMPTDGIPLEGFDQQDAGQTLEQGVNPSPLENVQKIANIGETPEAEAAPIDAPAPVVAEPEAAAEGTNTKQQSSQTDVSQQGAQAFAPLEAFTPQNFTPEVQPNAPQAALPQQLAQSAMAQTIEAIATGVQDGQRVLTLQMKPEFLGRLQMQLVMSEDGLTAKIRTSDPAVQSTLAAQISQLQAELEEKGILIKEVEVLLASPEEQFFEQRQSAPQQQFRQGGSTTRTRYARYADFEAQITQLSPGDEPRALENINGSVSFTA